jgi:hypothetical protein
MYNLLREEGRADEGHSCCCARRTPDAVKREKRGGKDLIARSSAVQNHGGGKQ